jgi:hypothetical protein
MITILTAIKISALLATIILPMGGPKRKKERSLPELSGLSVNANGFLEYFTGPDTDRSPIV